MKIATLLFTYSRSKHTKTVLDGLQGNCKLPEKMIIFQDGIKPVTDLTEWEKVNNLIHQVDFCPTEVIVAKENKGLAQSIIDGVNYAFQEYDAIIVLEDDCVPDRTYIDYMMQSLEKYEKNFKIFSVSGFSYPVSVVPDGYDIYFHGRFISWGWGTWNNRWAKFKRSPNILNRIMDDPHLSAWMAIWTKDSPRMFLDSLQGKNDSWAVYWALCILEHKGLCVSPYQSKILNIGFDGTGVHCGVTHDFDVVLNCNSGKTEYHFPECPVIYNKTKKAFIEKFGSHAVVQLDKSLEKIVVYGLGHYYFKHEKVLINHFHIAAYIDKTFHGYFAGRPILTNDMIENYKNIRVVIMLGDIKECEQVKEMLHLFFHIPLERISIGSELMKRIK